MTDWLDRTLPEVTAALRAGSVTATALIEAAVENHERWDDRLAAYLAFDAEAALTAAQEADRQLAEGSGGPLTGIPVSVKDLYGTSGLPTFAGTKKQLPDDPWCKDSWLIARLRAAGAIFVGKTHMVEMAFGGVGLNPHWGTPRNPWDGKVHRVPGGSSSGAGVSLWERSALIALGSDTGGSIRIPAAFTGTVGQRTTRGRWPTTGVVPLSGTFDTVGALTRTVEDSIYFFGVVDPAGPGPEALLERLAAVELDGIRIAVPDCGIWDDCEADIADVLRGSLESLGGAGATVSDVEAALIDEAFKLSLGPRPIAATECRAFLEQELPGWLETLDPIVGMRLAKAPSLDDPIYHEARADAAALAARSEEFFVDADVLALPANIIHAPAVDSLDDLDRYGAANAAILRPTYPISVLGLTAISIPVGLDSHGLPVGLQLVAPGMEDEKLLGIAWAAQRALGTAEELFGRPPMLGG